MTQNKTIKRHFQVSFIDSWVSDSRCLAAQATAFVLAFHFSAIKMTTRHCSGGWLRYPFSMRRSTLISPHLCHFVVLHSSDVYRLVVTYHRPLLSHFLISPPRLSFVLRLQLHAVPPEHQVLACWCQSRSPSWHGTCIDWHRTPAPPWPVPRLLGTLETLYPNLGRPQLLAKENNR